MLPNGATWISLHSLYGLYGLCSSMEYLKKKNQTAFNIEQKGKPEKGEAINETRGEAINAF